jgi:glycosyltransferase involved in cell wall biosynthesis
MAAERIWGTLDPFVEGGEFMGRSVANAGFLDALLRRDPFDAYHFFLGGGARGLERFLQERHPRTARRCRVLPRTALPEALARQNYHCFHLSDCINYPAHLARLRNAVGRRAFPITGVTHSLSYARYAAAFLAQLWAGCTPRDCVVATSRTGREVVRGFFASLRQHYGLDPHAFPGPEVARIPLGVDPQALAPAAPEERKRLRTAMGLGPDQVMLLVLGRISHFSKLDALPLLRALQRLLAAGTPPERLCLVLAGWMAPEDDLPGTLQALARNLKLDLRLIASPEDAAKLDLYRAADIFVSPVDNAQETFGLTILEAGCMGLPVVASDYDGYRDLVRHGETGLLVPTLGPEATDLADALSGVLYDNQHHLLLAQQTCVDVPGLARALETLSADGDLRARMGRAGRQRVLARYSWDRVVEQYLTLWKELNDRPCDLESLRAESHPLHAPHARVFGSYPSQLLSPDLRVVQSRAGRAVYRGQDSYLFYAGLEPLLPHGRDVREAVRTLLVLARNPVTAGDLQARLRETLETGPDQARFLLLWALKHDLLERAGDRQED